MSATVLTTSKPAVSVSGLIRSTVGRKAVMAVTGMVLVVFVIAHMLGNLQVYLGAEAMNDYAEWLRSVLHGAGLWIARAGLVAAVGLHIWAATSLTLESRAARPVPYRKWESRESTYASRTMRWGGVILLAFVVYHLLHFTFGTAHPDFAPGDVYRNFVVGFQNPWVGAVYIIANLILGMHLRHGVWSMMRTLGVSHPRYVAWSKAAAATVAAVVVLGNVSFPLAVLAGMVR
jgi:succinate dehydrogenase / fumarate reductase cytochrome b subunit